MTDSLAEQLRTVALLTTYDVCRQAANRIEELEQTLLDIFDHECRTSSTSLIACAARDALWQNNEEKTGDN